MLTRMKLLWFLLFASATLALILSAEDNSSSDSDNNQSDQNGKQEEKKEEEDVDDNDDEFENYVPCNRVQGAFTNWGVDFFIFGGGYVLGLNFTGYPVYRGNVGHMGFPRYVTAALNIPSEGKYYLTSFKEEQAFIDFGRNVTGSPLVESGALAAFENSPDFHGIDAAFMRGPNQIIYISGCDFIKVNITNDGYVYAGSDDLRVVGLPCWIDAAWSAGDLSHAYLLYGQTVYIWPADRDEYVGATNVYYIFGALQELALCTW